MRNFWHEKGGHRDRVGGTHVMSHDLFLLPDLNLIQIKDKKEKNQVSWERRVVPQLIPLCVKEVVGVRKNQSDFFLTPTHI